RFSRDWSSDVCSSDLKTEESRQIQEEMDRLVTEHRARIQANSDAVAKERERFFSWRLQKQQEEQKITDTVSHFVTENPITRGVRSEERRVGKEWRCGR